MSALRVWALGSIVSDMLLPGGEREQEKDCWKYLSDSVCLQGTNLFH